MKKEMLKNASYVFMANFLCIIINVVINFLVPIIFSENVYAYYQLENLYCGYLWILTLGWHEGIYIYYGGKKEEEINKSDFITQFWLVVLYLILVVIGVVIWSNYFFSDTSRKFVVCISMISVGIEAIRYIYLYYLICINKMKTYSKYVVMDRILYISLALLLVFTDKKGYVDLLLIDVLSKILVLLYIIYRNKMLFFGRFILSKKSWLHAKTLILSGINVTIAVFVNRFIVGTVRLAIDIFWGVLVFGKISLTLSISNMFTQFVQALSVILFPTLRRTTESGQKKVYIIISELLDAFMFFVFILYLPGVKILNIILPQYKDGMHYMAILLPICLFDARNIILNNTYLKALHKEKGLLFSNLISVICSVFFTYISVFVFQNLDLAVLTILILAVIKCFSSEIILQNTMGINLNTHMFFEILVSLVFIYVNWFISGIYGTLAYGIVLIMYYILKYQKIKDAFLDLKNIG